MSTRFYGSICITDLFEQLNKKHSAFSKADNGKVYANVTVWLNDEKDKFGHIMSVQLTPKKDFKEQDGQPYIGNMREAEQKPISSRDTNSFSIPSDIPLAEKPSNTTTDASGITQPIEDLPF